jgi:hypothetical protein
MQYTSLFFFALPPLHAEVFAFLSAVRLTGESSILLFPVERFSSFLSPMEGFAVDAVARERLGAGAKGRLEVNGAPPLRETTLVGLLSREESVSLVSR